MFFITHDKVTSDRLKDVSYRRIIVNYRSQKKEPHITRLTVRINLIDYAGDVSTPTTEITTAKLITNIAIYTPGARYMCCNIKKFYLGTTFIWYEYIKIPIDILPEEIIDEYNLRNIARNGYIYYEIRKVMYGLPQAEILANQQLVRRLEPQE